MPTAGLEDREGVPVKPLSTGADSDTTVPIVESFSWAHGVFLGATIESETTAATIGKEGVRQQIPWQPDFISVPFADYLANHLKFAEGLRKSSVFAVNYF